MRRLPAVRRRRSVAGLLLIACALLASCGSDESAESPELTSGSSVTTATTAPGGPAQMIAAARRAADRDEYDAALAISTSLRTAQARSVRRRIANRLAERALAALDAGARGRARDLIIEAKSYPSTEQARFTRATYEMAKTQAAEQRRRNAEQRRVAEAMRQAASMRPPPAMRMMPPPMRMTPSPP